MGGGVSSVAARFFHGVRVGAWGNPLAESRKMLYNRKQERTVRGMANDRVVFGGTEDGVARLKAALDAAETVVVGAGAGLSTSAGYTYSGARFDRYFGDFGGKYGFTDMYSGGFYPYAAPEEKWAYWSRYIYINRTMNPPRPVYENLLGLMGKKDYFVLTTNVDHCFQKAGFDKRRLFYTQGDYGLWQCSKPCHLKTYDNAETVRQMVEAQGFSIAEDGALLPPAGAPKMAVPTDLVPRCPRCGRPMAMNLRADDTFVEDAGWHEHAALYDDFLTRHKGTRTVFLELGVGSNTPVFCSMRTRRKSTRNAIKRQISEGSHTWINGFERRCA